MSGLKRRSLKRKGTASRRKLKEGARLYSDSSIKEKYFEIFIIVVLLAFGTYQSVLYFGHQVVPTGDFTAFSHTGHQLWSFKAPTSYKRAPALGLLLVPLGWLVGGQHPDLTAGWLLNALLHPFNLLLLWLIGREIVGRSAVWLALVAILNPWVIFLLTDPIVETTLLFFTLVTFYLIFRGSSWCYLFAAITTMVRYEGAALILVAFVMDMIRVKGMRQRIRPLLYSVLAAAPLALWMVCTVLSWQSKSSGHYLATFKAEYAKIFIEPIESRMGVIKHMNMLWRVGFNSLLTPYPGAGEAFERALYGLSKVVMVVSFFFGGIYGLCKRRWKILALLLFFTPYFLVHARYPYPILRFHTTIFWIALLICWFGLQSSWRLIDGRGRVIRAFVVILQVSVVIIAAIWLVPLVPYLSRISSMSPTSASLPYVAMLLVGLVFVARIIIYGAGNFVRELSILALLCLIIVSNQFTLVRIVGNGQRDIEFKLLADWYVANARPGEKLACYMTPTVRIFASKYAKYFVHFPKAENPSKFVDACYKRDLTYVVWATREGLSKSHDAYRTLGLDRNLASLSKPRSIGPYEFVTQLGTKRAYVNVFRLRRQPVEVKLKR